MADQLVEAAKTGNLALVKTLLDQGIDPNQADRNGDVALWGAAIGFHPHRPEVVKELLNRGADPNLPQRNGKTVIQAIEDRLWVKLHRGRGPKDRHDWRLVDDLKEIINLINERNNNPGIIDPKTGVSSLAIVAANGPTHRLIMMIDQNPNLNQQDQDGNTPLIYAIVNRKPEHVELLLDRGADPNLANFGGGTPLAYAIQLDQPQIEQMLIDAGAQ